MNVRPLANWVLFAIKDAVSKINPMFPVNWIAIAKRDAAICSSISANYHVKTMLSALLGGVAQTDFVSATPIYPNVTSRDPAPHLSSAMQVNAQSQSATNKNPAPHPSSAMQVNAQSQSATNKNPAPHLSSAMQVNAQSQSATNKNPAPHPSSAMQVNAQSRLQLAMPIIPAQQAKNAITPLVFPMITASWIASVQPINAVPRIAVAFVKRTMTAMLSKCASRASAYFARRS
jgi:hypothetical protein